MSHGSVFVFSNSCEEQGAAWTGFFFFFSLSQFDLDHSVTKSSPEACDLHAICLLNLKFVSVSMTMNKSYVVHLS